MDFEEGMELIFHAFSEKKKDMLFFRWVTNYENLGLSFDEFEKKLKPIVVKTEKEILKEVEEILQLEI